MAIGGSGLAFAGSLRARVIILTIAAMTVVAVPAAFAFVWIVNTTVVKIGTLFAENQILFDRYRGLESLMREVSLAETLARSPTILEWAKNPSSISAENRGIAELEHFRISFRDKSYFAVIGPTGDYYFNDKEANYLGRQKRYTVSADNPRDGWYFKTAAYGSGCHLNVDRDDNLNVTKVWINCIISEGGRVLGIIGSGVDLSWFIREVVDFPQDGVQSMFVDRAGAVQAHRDPRFVDFHSLTKDIKAKKTIYGLIDDDEGRNTLSAMMQDVADGRSLVRSSYMRIGGHDYLVGVGYLDRLGWFNVTLMDIDQIVDWRMFAPIALLLAAILVGVVALLSLLFRRSVLDRLERVERGIRFMQAGDFSNPIHDDSPDEIGRLSRAFGDLAESIGTQTGVLEKLVSERTEKLEHLASLDPLTEISNRRGFIRRFGQEKKRRLRRGRHLGLLLIDVDHFKTINDSLGHDLGDRVLLEFSRRISSALSSHDICARWGGDEFIILLADCNAKSLEAMAERLLNAFRQASLPIQNGGTLSLTASIGGYLVKAEDELPKAAERADAALYAAKREGRNRFALYCPSHTLRMVG